MLDNGKYNRLTNNLCKVLFCFVFIPFFSNKKRLGINDVGNAQKIFSCCVGVLPVIFFHLFGTGTGTRGIGKNSRAFP